MRPIFPAGRDIPFNTGRDTLCVTCSVKGKLLVAGICESELLGSVSTMRKDMFPKGLSFDVSNLLYTRHDHLIVVADKDATG